MLIHSGSRVSRGDILLIVLLALLTGVNCKKSKTNVVAKFTYNKTCGTTGYCQVSFSNQSQNADSYQWDFGDGTVSVEFNPVHNFSQSREYYVVTLKAISLSGPTENIAKDTVFIVNRPQCQNIGSFQCASKLESGVPIRDRIRADHSNNYYYFVMPSAGVAKIQLSPVPSGSYLYLYLLSEAKDNSPTIKYEYGYPGETIMYYAGPLAADSFFIRVDPPSNAGSEMYDITYTFIGDDANEMNNVFSQATELTLGVGKQGQILSTTDLDYFKFYLSQPHIVDITLSPVPNFPSNGNLTVEVYTGANSSSLLNSKYGYPGETIKMSEGPLDAGWYYIKLKAGSKESTDKYTLTVATDDRDVYEVNNIFSTATTIQRNQLLTATLKGAGDVDFYKYTAPVSGPCVVSIDKIPTGINYMYVTVYNAANASANIDSEYETPGNALTFTVGQNFVAGNTYYFKVWSWNASQFSSDLYKFKVNQ